MKMKRCKNALSWTLCAVLIVAMALMTTGCSDNADQETAVVKAVQVEPGEVAVLGEGSRSFAFTVVDLDGNEDRFEIHTDQTIVGEALTELGLLVGEEGPYGLFVKEVNGIRADYDKDKVFWGFYVNDTMGMTGVDQTEITEGDVYSFRISK